MRGDYGFQLSTSTGTCVHIMAFSAGWIATGSADGSLDVWDDCACVAAAAAGEDSLALVTLLL